MFASDIVLIIIASIFDFNGKGGIINGGWGGEDVQYKLICRLFVFVSVIVLITIANIFDFNGSGGGIINGGRGGGGGRTIQANMSIICLFQSLFSSS